MIRNCPLWSGQKIFGASLTIIQMQFGWFEANGRWIRINRPNVRENPFRFVSIERRQRKVDSISLSIFSNIFGLSFAWFTCSSQQSVAASAPSPSGIVTGRSFCFSLVRILAEYAASECNSQSAWFSGNEIVPLRSSHHSQFGGSECKQQQKPEVGKQKLLTMNRKAAREKKRKREKL